MHRLTALTLVVVALCSLGGVDSSAYDKIVYHSRIRARTQGPNVCSLQQVPGTNKKYFSTCQNWYRGSICGKKAKVLYECCPGYVKMEGMKGCTGVAPIENVYNTLGLVKATTTQQYAEMSKLRDEIEAKGSITMFAPSNEAWSELDSEVRSALESNVNIELYNALHFHMVNRRFLTKDLKNDLTLTSLYNDLGLYINHYPNGVVTVNCARIIHANQIASNGVVHVIDRVIGFVSNTIKGALDANEDLSSFNAAALASGMMEKLDKPGHYTLFAPTNAAFNKLAPGHLERIMSDKAVIAALVNYHLLNTAQCSEAIMSGTAYETAEGSTIQIGCDGDSLTVNGIKMVLKKDIVTTNGVIHLIDSVLIPDSAKEVKELLGETQSKFGEMVSELGLAAALGPKTQYTLLAPVNTAFTKEVRTTDQSLLRYILENHILKFKVTLSELYNGQMLETLAGKLLRVFIYRTAVCIENSCMTRGAKEGSNGALHVMRSIIKPANKNIYELLIADGRFKIFLSLMETAGLIDLLKQEGSYTAFAPTDDAFEGLSQEDMTLLKSDLNALRVILLYHISNGVLINGGLEGGVTNLLKTLQGNNLQVMSVNNSIHVNSVGVPDSDLMATNGVIHVVKNVLYPADLPVGRQDLLVLLRKLIKYIKIKFIAGYTYTEIPITFIKRTITTYVETVPDSKTVVRVIEGSVQKEPTITKVTRVIETEPTVTLETKEEPVITKVTRVIETGPTVTLETEEEPVVTKVTRVIETGPTVSEVVVDKKPVVSKVTRVIETVPKVTGVVTRVITGETSQTTLTTVTGENPSISKVTRVIEGGKLGGDNQRVSGGTRFTEGFEPHIIEVPDFSRITTIHGDPSMVEEESERITKIIQEGGKFAAARKAPAGMRRRQRLVRRHHKPKQ